MRLTDDEILARLTHPDRLVRDLAHGYFQELSPPHPRYFSQARAAFERFGREQAFPSLPSLNPALADEDLRWVIEQFADSEDPGWSRHWKYVFFDLDIVTISNHTELLKNSQGLTPEEQAALQARFDLLQATPESAWAGLEAWAENLAKSDAAVIGDVTEPARWTEVLARHDSPELRARVTSVLAHQLTDEVCAADYLVRWAIELAGILKMEELIPVIMEWDAAGWDFLWDATGPALDKMQAERHIAALMPLWESDDPERQITAALQISSLRGDEALQVASAWLPETENAEIFQMLSHGIACHFDAASLDLIADEARKNEIESETCEILAGLAIGLEIEHPRLPQWRAWIEAGEPVRLRKARMAEMMHQCGPGCDHDHDHDHDHHADEDEAGVWDAEEEPETASPGQAPIVNAGQHVGRNDPCPCGSGKKYKKCCLRAGAVTDVLNDL